jgi:phosphatidylserine/phosphatidylglycerophosphate/cardiolipin synthase-like enzyme
MRIRPIPASSATAGVAGAPVPAGAVELVIDQEHFERVIRRGILEAKISLDIATADFKALLIPAAHLAPSQCGRGRNSAVSIVKVLGAMAGRGVEIRILHAGVPSSPALRELRRGIPRNLVMRRCPRLHAKTVIVDARAMYLGSANLTGAGLGAKADGRRNIEWGIWTASTALIDRIAQQFNRLWEGRQCPACRRHEVCPVPLEEPKLGTE